ncbi:hypothetical protein SLA2020_451820 [Shorea laevis]
MPVRQMKESSEQHLVIKTHLQNSMNPVQKAPKTAQNGKGPPPQEPHNAKPLNQTSPPSKNKEEEGVEAAENSTKLMFVCVQVPGTARWRISRSRQTRPELL